MIEQALRDRLQPIVNRRKRLYSASGLSICWFALGLVGILLMALRTRLDISASNAFVALCLAAVVAAIIVIRRSNRFQPDFRAVARDIEQHHPELKALLLTAVEQKPEGPDGQFGYLQIQVLKEALIHATDHDWLESVPARRLKWAGIARTATLLFLIVVLSQMLPGPLSVGGARLAQLNQGTQVTVMPGDTKIEAGTRVLVTARFDGQVPDEASVLFGPAGQEPQQLVLTRPLADPVFGGLISQIKSDMVYRIAYRGQRTRDFTIHVFEYPALTKADAKIAYPSYTKLPEKLIEDTRQISVVEGSQVTLSFTLNKPVATARLVPKEGQPVDLVADANRPNVYTTSQTMTQSQRYELRLTDADGLAAKIPPRFAVDVHKNLPAQIKPVFPNRDVEASPIEELNLQAEASDDFGLTKYGVTWSLVGVQDQEVTLGPAPGAAGKQNLSYLLALEPLNAKPDQLLTYYFWAEDIGPDGQTRRTSSDIYFAEVRPFEQIFRESQSFQNQQDREQQQPENQDGQQSGRQRAEQLVRLQKQIITATWNIKQKADASGKVTEQKDDLEVVRQSQQDALNQAQQAITQAEDPTSAKALQAAGGHMQTSLDRLTESTQSASASPLTPAIGAEQAAYQELLKLRQREFQVAQSQRGNRSNNNSAQFDQQLRQLELTQRENRYESERLARSQQQQTQREDLQVLNRLRDLARRQSDMSDRLREAETSLRQARNDQEREQIRRELQRLRDEQLQAMQDVDELQARMDQPENRQRMSDTGRQLDESRSQIRESTDQLEQGMVSNAITSTTRAQRQLEQMRDEFQRNTSSQFTEEMRNMREQAQELDRRQRQISEQLRQQNESGFRSLTDNGATQELANQLNRQRTSTQELTDQMKSVSEQSENSEPLLSRSLYDTIRQTSTQNIDRSLEVTEELLRRNFVPQAQETEPQAAQGITDLRKGVEEAAASVLGDEAESLRLAQQQLDNLLRQVNDEATRAGRRGAGDPNRLAGDPNQAVAGGDANQPRMANAQSPQGRRGGQPGQRGQRGQSADQQQQQGEQGQGDVATDQQQGQGQGQGGRGQRMARGGRGQQGDTQQNGVARGNRGMRGNQNGQATAGGDGGQVANDTLEGMGPGPLTGNDYRQWSDQLRDVEEMLPQQDLRNQVARVRDQARTMRTDFLRRSKEPQWDLVQQDIMRPLAELRQRITDRLAQLQSEDKLVPIDRDPVPDRFAEAVRRYFENLGGDNK
jgi:hypothetical protein